MGFPRLAIRRLTILVVAGIASGCAAIAGADFGGVHARDVEDDASDDASLGDSAAYDSFAGDSAFDRTTPPADSPFDAPAGDSGTTAEAGPPDCGTTGKLCGLSCVMTDDPSYGCAAAACAGCSLPNVSTAACAEAGTCAIAQCAAGHADCDHNPANGCEADLGYSGTCGSCTMACTSGQVCGATGCVTDCPGGTALCGTSCVDLTSSATNCGSCGHACPTEANSDPACNGGVCGITCHAGYADCDGNPANGCEALTTFYQDNDHDGFGSTVTHEACTTPGGYADKTGDCDDANANVFPGQSAYFTTAYTTPASLSSFDYNCDGQETEEAVEAGGHYSCADCSAFSGGYTPAVPARSGTGVDPYCGSTGYSYCVYFCFQGCQCLTGEETKPALPCH